MGNSLDRSMRIQRLLAQSLVNLIDNTERFYWSHQFYMEKRTEHIYQTENWKLAPRWVVTYLEGIEAARMQLWYRHKLVFSYVHNGKRVLLGTNDFRKIPPNQIDTSTGAYVWRDKPENEFSGYRLATIAN